MSSVTAVWQSRTVSRVHSARADGHAGNTSAKVFPEFALRPLCRCPPPVTAPAAVRSVDDAPYRVSRTEVSQDTGGSAAFSWTSRVSSNRSFRPERPSQPPRRRARPLTAASNTVGTARHTASARVRMSRGCVGSHRCAQAYRRSISRFPGPSPTTAAPNGLRAHRRTRSPRAAQGPIRSCNARFISPVPRPKFHRSAPLINDYFPRPRPLLHALVRSDPARIFLRAQRSPGGPIPSCVLVPRPSSDVSTQGPLVNPALASGAAIRKARANGQIASKWS